MMDEHSPSGKSDSPVIYVEALEGPEDYWLSITDAARVTRRQEVSIRRWIARGLLPVRQRKIGLNQRTRQVRVSDLKKLTEIIDPTAVITSEEGKLDLVSIPRQQQQILAEYKQVTTQVSDLSGQVERSATILQDAIAERREASMLALTQLQNALAIIDTQQQETLAALLRAIEDARGQQQERHLAALQAIEAASAEQGQYIEHWGQQLTQETEAVKTQQERLADRLGQQFAEQRETARHYQVELLAHDQQHREALDQALSTLTALFAEQSASLDRAGKELQTVVEHQTATLRALELRLEAAIGELAQQFRTLLEPLSGQLSAIAKGQDAYGKAAEAQAGVLSRMLEEQARTLSQLTEQQILLYERMQQYPPPSQEQLDPLPDVPPQGREQHRLKRS